MKKNKIINLNISLFIFIFLFIILNIYITLQILNKESFKNNITRIHVIANSNSIEDQLIKIKIYEKINEYIKTLNINDTTLEIEKLKILANNSNNILEIANKTLKDNNKEYTSTLDIGKIYYEKKDSININMSEGCYNSIRINLGKAEGKNIWSLIFPNEQTIEKLSTLNSILPGISNIYNNDTNINKEVEYSFKILEIFNKK